MMKAQQAPPEARHSWALVAEKFALMKAHSTSAGIAISRNHATNTVMRIFSGDENRRDLTHAHGPTWVLGGGRPSAGICEVLLISTLHQRDALVVPIHEYRNRQADREVRGHDDENA